MSVKMQTIAFLQGVVTNGAVAVNGTSGGITSLVRNAAGAYTVVLDPDIAEVTPAGRTAGHIIYTPAAAEVVLARVEGATPGSFRLFFTDPATGALTEVTGQVAVEFRRSTVSG